MIRKWLCLLLVFMLVFPAVSGLADNPDGETLEYMYSFIPGTVLEGEGTKMIRELLDEVKIRFTRQKTETNDIIRIQLISNGTDAFSLTAGQMGGEEFALMCSLLGSNKLTLKQEQIAPFLHTLVESLGEQGFLKGDNLNKMYSNGECYRGGAAGDPAGGAGRFRGGHHDLIPAERGAAP